MTKTDFARGAMYLSKLIAGLSVFGVLGIAIGLAWPSGRGDGGLCSSGHPVPRRADVTYGGLTPAAGYQRDHFIPLCLGGADVAAADPAQPPGPSNPGNVWYQAYPEAREKDRDEWSVCEAYCRGEVELGAARQVIEEWWRDNRNAGGRRQAVADGSGR
jgi:hypothetical protein